MMHGLHVLFRRLAAAPGFTILSLLTLAVGVGANVAIFTVVNAVLIRPLPLPESDRLVMLQHAAPALSQLDELPISDALYVRYAEESRTLESVAMIEGGPASFTGPGNPERVDGARVTASFFDVARTQPRIGRAFTVDDERGDARRVAILSDDLWRRRFGGDPDAVGRVVDIDGDRVEVVGVTPPGFVVPSQPYAELWRPLTVNRAALQLGAFGAQGIGRMAAGASLTQVQAELETMLSNLPETFPEQAAAPFLANAGLRPLVRPAREFVVGDIGSTLWILLGAVGFLLLITCANVANLFLVRSEGRAGELAIRAALGETRGRLTRSLLLESVALGVGGGLLALPLAWAAVRLVIRFGPQNLPRLEEVSIDGGVLLFGLAVSVAAGLLLGLLPAVRSAAVSAAAARMTEGARAATGGRRRQRLRQGLVVTQIALALTLLIGSGLAVRSYQRLAAVDPGFNPDGVLSFGVALPARGYETPASRLNFRRTVVDRLAALPGATSAAAASALPFEGRVEGSGHSIEGQPTEENDVPTVFMLKRVSPGFFEAMGIELLEGRDFDPLDEGRDGAIVIVSRSLAEASWPDESAIGRGIRAGGPPNEEEGEAWSRVVGVVDDVYELGLNQDPPEMAYYLWIGQVEGGEVVPAAMRFVVRAPVAAALAGAVRDSVAAIDPNLPVSDIETLDTLIARSHQERVFVMVLLIIAAALALLLGAVGLYGVVAYGVAQRQRELAIRIAIGAQASDISRLVIGEAARMAAVGVIVGIAAAVALTRRLQALLYETSAVDPVVFAGVSAVLIAICLLASWLPARRAGRIDPMGALRIE